LDTWEEGKEPLEMANLLMAIRWVADAWERDVMSSTLFQTAFEKARFYH
jgi:hypothetical protein